MNLAKPLLVSFSLLAFSAAYAQGSGPQDKQAQQPQQSQQSQPMQSQVPSAAQTQTPSQDQPQSQSRQSSEQQQSASGGASAQSANQIGANELIGKKVHGKDGKEIGEIDDVVLDMQSGKVHAAVLQFGGILGMGEKNYAFPISELQPGKQKGQYTMDVDKQKLEKAQGFAKGQWPEMNDEYWGRVGGQASAGASQSSQGKQAMNLVRASKIKGKDVSDQSGQKVGEIEDVIVDLQSGQVQNIALKVEGGGQAQVPPQELKAGTDDKFVVSMDAEQLKQQAKSSSRQRQQSRSDQGSGASSGGQSGQPEAGSAGQK